MMFNAIFNNTYVFQLYRDVQFYWWRKADYLKKKRPTHRKSLTNFII